MDANTNVNLNLNVSRNVKKVGANATEKIAMKTMKTKAAKTKRTTQNLKQTAIQKASLSASLRKPEREPKRKPEREPKRGEHGRRKKPNQEDCDEDSEQEDGGEEDGGEEDGGEEDGDEESDGDGSCCNKTSELLRVVVDDGVQEEVYSNGPISIFAGCVADNEQFPARVILSVLVTPEDSDSEMEYVMTSWEDDIQTATSDEPYSTFPTSLNLAEYTWTDVGSYGMISIATASGHYVGFDGSSIMASVVSSEEEPGWGCASSIKETDDMGTKRCIIMGPLEVY
ncbi:unnamed protein product [Ectocarpus sp. 6 AP-2014]